MLEFFQPDNKHPSAGLVSSRANVGIRLLFSAARRAASLASKEESVTQACEMVHHALRARCSTAKGSPLDRDGLKDIPQATLEHLELGDHRKETAPQVEVRLQLSRNR